MTILLLTDRPNDGARLQQTLQHIRPCQVMALHQAGHASATPALIVCDVSMSSLVSIELLRTSISNLRKRSKIPLLCLTRDPSQLTLAQAQDIGSTAVLSRQAPVEDIGHTVKRLLAATDAGSEASPRDATKFVKTSAQEAGQALFGMLKAAKKSRPISVATLDRGGRVVLDAVEQGRVRIWLDVVSGYDDVTYQHSLLVAGLVAAFSLELGLTHNQRCLLSQAALIHDIGKASIPVAILNKTTKLSPVETVLMRTHAAVGYDLLVTQTEMDPIVLDIVRHHHEYLDGSGYPDGLQGSQISRLVRLVTICDIYAALIERRAYKDPMPSEDAFAILHSMSGKLDQQLVRAFGDLVHVA